MKNFGALVQGVGKPNRLGVSDGQNISRSQDGPKDPAISREPIRIHLYVYIYRGEITPVTYSLNEIFSN